MDFTAPIPLIAAWIIIAPVIVFVVLNAVAGNGSDQNTYRVRHDDPVVPPRTL